MNCLGIEQQKLVEENHNLIYSFAQTKQINLDEFYDLLAIALCKAALVFDETKGAFSTLAYMCMANEIKLIRRKESTQRVIPKYVIDSLDYIYTSDKDNNETTMQETLIKDVFPAPDESVVNSIMFNDFYNNKLNNREKVIIDLLLQDKNQTDIGNLMSISQPQVSRLIKGIKTKWIELNK